MAKIFAISVLLVFYGGMCLSLVTNPGWTSTSLASPGAPSRAKFFDLGYNLDSSNIFYPGQRFDRYVLYKDIQGFNNTPPPHHDKFWFAMYSFCMGEHGGTHVDAPFHFNKNGWKLAEIPIERLMDVPVAVIDVEKYVFSLPNPQLFKLEVWHILEHEMNHGPIPFGAVVLVHFGWGRYWPDRRQFFGIQTNGTMSFPGLDGAASKWLVDNRKVVGVGVDSASLDIGNNGGYLPSHITLAENQVYMIENVANLGYLLKNVRPSAAIYSQIICDLRLSVLPIKALEGTGGPARIIAYCKNEL